MQIIPAILTAEPNVFKAQLIEARRWSTMTHIDVADGEFVPNRTLDYPTLTKLLAEFPFDHDDKFSIELHLMIKNPFEILDQALGWGFAPVVVHIETLADPTKFVREIHARRLPIGIAINPSTPDDKIKPILSLVPHLMMMGIEPGFQGRTFQSEILGRIAWARRENSDLLIEVDGGVNPQTITPIIQAGADRVVAGSAIWKSGDPKNNYQALNQLALQISKS